MTSRFALPGTEVAPFGADEPASGWPLPRRWPAVVAFGLTGSLVTLIGIAVAVHLWRLRPASTEAASSGLEAAGMLAPGPASPLVVEPVQPPPEEQGAAAEPLVPRAVPVVRPRAKPSAARGAGAVRLAPRRAVGLQHYGGGSSRQPTRHDLYAKHGSVGHPDPKRRPLHLDPLRTLGTPSKGPQPS